MLVLGDLGFPGLLLLLLLLFLCPVISFFVRRKWRLAVAREEEIRRLLVLASEEAARAELEASAEYGAYIFSSSPQLGPSQPPLQSQCAVCCSPTTTRCSRCKAARYCSGKCQIIHWRQGHKDYCHPPSTDHPSNDQRSKSTYRVLRQESFGNHVPECKEVIKSVERHPEIPVEALFKKDENSKEQLFSEELRRKPFSESPSARISPEFVPSAASSDSFVDAPGEEISSNYAEKSSLENKCADIVGDRHWAPSGINPIDVCSSSNTKVRETHNESNTTLDSDCDVSDVCSCDSDRWSDADDGKSSTNSETDDGKLSESGAFLRFSFNLAGKVTTPLLSKDSELKPDSPLVVEKPIDDNALSERYDIGSGISKVMVMPSLNSEKHSHAGSEPVIDSHKLEPRKVSSLLPGDSCGWSSSIKENSGSTHASGDIRLSNLSFKRTEHVVSTMSSTADLPKKREVELPCTDTSDAIKISNSGRHSLSSDSSAKVDNDHTCASILHHPPNVSNGLKTSTLKVDDQIKPAKLSKNYQVEAGSETAKNNIDKGHFPYELFVKLYQWKKMELRPCGLINCGNSCYANVVLQCLAFTPPLTAYLLQRLHSKACGKREWCFTCEFENLVVKAKEGKSPLSPIGILSQIGKISSHLIGGKEEDAHEFLRFVIDTMQSACLDQPGTNGSWPYAEETSLMGLTFGGYLRSKIKCMKCRGKSERHERMMDLTVEIDGDIGSLEEALRKFTGTEILDGENKYKCSRCKSYEKAKKKLTVLDAPNVLTIALKRFQSGKFGKLNKSIRFPEILDLAPYMSGTSDKSPIYSLYGVVVHVDIMNAAFSGHYVCYVKNMQNKWFMIDDSTVKAVERERVLTKGAYMLLYARCSPRAPKLLRDTVLCHDVRARHPCEVKNSSSKSSLHPAWIPPDGPTSVDYFCMGKTRKHRIFDLDSSSDNSSLISGSDEGSCSTESTRDSSSTDDFSEYIFGDSGYGWNSPYWGSSDFDASLTSSSSSSSLFSRHSSLSDLDHYASGCTGTVDSRANNGYVRNRGDGVWARVPSGFSRQADAGGKRHVPSMYSDTTKHCRNLVSCSCRETDTERLDWANPRSLKSSVSFRR